MTIIELFDSLSRGNEIEFIYKNKKYSITHSTEGIHVMEAYEYSTEKIYKLPKEVGEYSVEEKKLKDFFSQAEITFRCF